MEQCYTQMESYIKDNFKMENDMDLGDMQINWELWCMKEIGKKMNMLVKEYYDCFCLNYKNLIKNGWITASRSVWNGW